MILIQAGRPTSARPFLKSVPAVHECFYKCTNFHQTQKIRVFVSKFVDGKLPNRFSLMTRDVPGS